jgi:hypothetical protein
MRWQDWASFSLGLWLAMSPWLLDYSGDEAATANAASVGLVLALGSHFEVAFDEISVEWLNFAAGIWLLAAPFVLGFSGRPDAAANSVAVGTLAALLAASALSLDKEAARFWNERVARSRVARS